MGELEEAKAKLETAVRDVGKELHGWQMRCLYEREARYKAQADEAFAWLLFVAAHLSFLIQHPPAWPTWALAAMYTGSVVLLGAIYRRRVKLNRERDEIVQARHLLENPPKNGQPNGDAK